MEGKCLLSPTNLELWGYLMKLVQNRQSQVLHNRPVAFTAVEQKVSPGPFSHES